MRHPGHNHLWWAGATFGALLASAVGCSSSPKLEKSANAGTEIGSVGQAESTERRAPDPTGRGEFTVATSEYRLAASTDPTIMTDRATEIWARVWRPQTDELEGLPLVVFLHGNHGTCGTFALDGFPLPNGPRVDDRIDYTTTGTCPRAGQGNPPALSDYVVSPSHEGYSYLAEQLASRGYLVVSINANRGITAGRAQDLGTPGFPFIEDRGLNLARARLVLKHLELLSKWNRGIEPTPGSLGFSLQGAIDFRKVALVGHSRGGEGVRGAYNIYTGRNTDINPYVSINWQSRIAATVDFKGIFEIAPVDRQTVRTLNAEGTTWSVMLPGCDGDVINQQGMWPYDRMMKSFSEQPARQKAFYYVVGANHNFFNSEWQTSDGCGCYNRAVQLFETDTAVPQTDCTGVLAGTTGSERQRTTGSASILALVRGTLRPEDDESSGFLRNFDPQFQLPPVVTNVARIERGFVASPSSTVTLALEDFDQTTGISQFGVPNQTSNVTVEHVPVTEHGFPFRFRDPTGAVRPLPAFLRAGVVSWQQAGANVYYQINLAAEGSGLDLSDFKTLDFRVDRESPKKTALNPTVATNFHIQLVGADGTLSEAVAASDVIDLVGPFGTPDADLSFIPAFASIDGYHVNLPTARVPMGAFRFQSHLRRARGIRLTFDDTPSGKIYVTNFRASRQGIRSLEGGGDAEGASIATFDPSAINGSTRTINQGNLIEDVQFVPAEASRGVAGVDNGTVRFTVWSERAIPPGDELTTMSVGVVVCDGSYVDGSTRRMMFECPAAAMSSVADGEQITVSSNGRTRWNFGAFSNAMVK